VSKGLTQGVAKDLERLHFEDTGDMDQLDDGDASVASLNLSDCHRVPAEFGGQLPLREPSFSAKPRDRLS
jgi:hypothetical protein